MKKALRYIIAFCVCLFALMLLSPYLFQGKAAQNRAAGYEQGDLFSFNEALAYYNGDGVEQNYENALSGFRSTCHEVTESWLYMGIMYRFGLGTEQNSDYANQCFAVAVSKDVEYADLCRNGLWCFDTECLSSVLPAGAVDAYFRGMESYYGVTVKQNFPAAYESFQTAAQLSNPYGYYGLGLCSLFGNGTEKNVTEAIQLLEKASQLGCPEAMEKLILIYSGECSGALDQANSKSLSHIYGRYANLLSAASELGVEDTTSYAAEAALLTAGPSASERATEQYRSLFCGNITSPASAADFFEAGIWYLTCGNFGVPEADVDLGIEMLQQADLLGASYASHIIDEVERENVREEVKAENAEKLQKKQERAAEGTTVTLSDKERSTVPTPAEVKAIVKTYLYDQYNITSNYWLLYQDSTGALKVRIVHIPAVQEGQTASLYDRFNDARILSFSSISSGYVSEMFDTEYTLTEGFSSCSMIRLYALDETDSLYKDLNLPETFLAFQQQYAYSDYFSGNLKPDNYYMTQEDLCTLYIDLIPAEFRPY